MTAVSLATPATGAAATVAAKPGTGSAAGFANALLSLLAGPAPEAASGSGNTTAEPGTAGQQPVPPAQTVPPQLLLAAPVLPLQGAAPEPAQIATPVSPAQPDLCAATTPAATVPRKQAPAAEDQGPADAASVLSAVPLALPLPVSKPAPTQTGTAVSAAPAAPGTVEGPVQTAVPEPQASVPVSAVAARTGGLPVAAPAPRKTSAPATTPALASAPTGQGQAAVPVVPPTPVAQAAAVQASAAPAAGPVWAVTPPVAAPAASAPQVPVSAVTAAAPQPGTQTVTQTVSEQAPQGGQAPATEGSFAQLLAPAVPTQGAPAAAAPPAPVPAGYTAQLARPLFTMATAGPGEHTMTVQVNPENLGPVTVQAHIGSSGIRIEMFATSADGRDVLRQALPELKRDLAGAGINASLDLSANSQGFQQGGQDRESFTRRFQTSNQPASGGRPLEVKAENTRTRPGLTGPETILDVMA